MKTRSFFPVLAIAGGAIAFILRIAQNFTGFFPDSNLPIPGNLPAGLLFFFLVALTGLLFFLTHRMPVQSPDPRLFREVFTVQGAIAPLTTGLFLMALSGAFSLWREWSHPPALLTENSQLLLTTPSLSPATIVLGILTILSAACLLPTVLCASVGKRSSFRHIPRSEGLLVPILTLVLRLVLVYRIRSIDPSLETYAVELLAIVCTILAFFYLASFAFDDGDARFFTLWSVLSIIFNLTTLADGHHLSDVLFYSSCVLIQLGFLFSFHPHAVRSKVEYSRTVEG